MKGSVLLTLLVIELSCGSLHTLYDQLCVGIHNGFLRHPVDCHKFIRCSHQRAVEFHCPANLLWHQEIKSCDYSYRTECKVNAIGVKGQKVNVTEMLMGQHDKLKTSDKALVTATTQKPTRKLHNKVHVLADKAQKHSTTVKDHVNTTDHKEHSVKLTQAYNKNIDAKEYFVKNVTAPYSQQTANPEQENLGVTTENATKNLNFPKELPYKEVEEEIGNVNDLAVSHEENKSRIKRNNCNSVSKSMEKAPANKNNKSTVKNTTVNNVNLTGNSTVKANSVNGLNLTEDYAVKITDNINNENITVNLKNDFNLTAIITEETVPYKKVKITEAILTEFPKPDSGITKNLNNSLNLKENNQNETVTTSSPENNNKTMLTEKTVYANAVNVTEPMLIDFQNASTEITGNLNKSPNSMNNKDNETSENNNRTMLIEKTVAVNAANVTDLTLIDLPKESAEITNNLEDSLNLKESTVKNQNQTEASSTDNINRTLITEESIYVNLTEAILTDFPNVHNFLNFKENKTVTVTASSAENNNRTMLTTETVFVNANANTLTEAILTDFPNVNNSLNFNENKTAAGTASSAENNNRTMLTTETVSVNDNAVTEANASNSSNLKDNKAVAQKQSSNADNSTHNSSILEEQTDSVTDVENRQTTAAIFDSLNTTEGFTGNHNSAMLKQETSSANFINSSETILENFAQALETITESSGSTNTENENVAVAKNTTVYSQSSPKNSSATVTKKKTNNVNSILLTDSLLKGFQEAFEAITESTSAINENVTKIMDNYLNTNSYNENISETGLEKDNNTFNDIDLTQSLLKDFTESTKATTESSVNFLSLTDNVTVNITDIEEAITQDPFNSITLTQSSTETNNRNIAASTVNNLNITDNNTVKVTDKESESEILTAQDPVNSFNSTATSTETSNKHNFTNFTLQQADKNHAVNLTEAMLAGVSEDFNLIPKDTIITKQNSDKNNDVNNIPLTVTMLKDLTEDAVNPKSSLNSTENVTVTETDDENTSFTVAAENSHETVSKTAQADNVNLTVNAENPVNSFNLTESFNPTYNSESLTDLNLTANFPVKKTEEEEENVSLTVNAEIPLNNVNVIESFNQTNKTSGNVLTENPENSVKLTENIVEYITEATAKDFSVKLTYNENKIMTENTDYSINDKNDKETKLTEATDKTANDENKSVTDFLGETTSVINGNTNKAEKVTATMLTADDEIENIKNFSLILKEIPPTNETFIQNTENSVNIGNFTEIMSTKEAVNNEHVKETMFTDDPVKNVDDEIQNFKDFYTDTQKNTATTESLMENTENSVKFENVKETIFTANPVNTADNENPNFKDFSIETTPLLKQYTAPTNTHLIAETFTETPLKNVNNTMLKANLTESLEINNSLESKNLTNLSTAITTTQILLNKNVQTESTTPAIPTNLAVLSSIDNTTVDPRLPFRSLECQGPNNRRQFKAPKCYQYYQCFAGWAFLLNCHEGWRFEVTEGQCILDVNKECEL